MQSNSAYLWISLIPQSCCSVVCGTGPRYISAVGRVYAHLIAVSFSLTNVSFKLVFSRFVSLSFYRLALISKSPYSSKMSPTGESIQNEVDAFVASYTARAPPLPNAGYMPLGLHPSNLRYVGLDQDMYGTSMRLRRQGLDKTPSNFNAPRIMSLFAPVDAYHDGSQATTSTR